MAVVGEAHIVVRAITTSVARDINKSFNGLGGSANRAGRAVGQNFQKGFSSGTSAQPLQKFSDALQRLSPTATQAIGTLHTLTRTGHTLGAALGGIIGGISSVISSLAALGGSALGAGASLASLGNILVSVGAGMAVAKLALGGVGKAISALNNPTGGGGGGGGGSGGDNSAAVAAVAKAREAAAERIAEAEKALARVIESNRKDLIEANNDVRDSQLALNEALAAGAEEIKQLGFDAEDAALNEKQAALTLEKARLGLLAVQDLPPNDRARAEAELAYQEADLNLRKAKSASQDLNKEQDRLAKTGVAGTQVVIDAQDALVRAQQAKAQAVVDALQDQQDATDDLAKAQKDQAGIEDAAAAGGASGGGGGGGADPFAGLNQAQIDFAKFIAGLKPKFDELKKIAAESFLPLLTKAIDTLMTQAFPTVAYGVGVIGNAMGLASISIADAIVKAENLKDLTTVFTSSGVIIEGLGKIIGNVWGAALSILQAAAPVAERFIRFLTDLTGRFDAFLNQAQADGSLQKFFTLSADAAAKFGTIFGNIFGGFGKIIMANLGPGTGGDYLLNWLITATDKFANLDKTVGGSDALNGYFLGAAKNAQSVLSALGSLLKVFISIGDNPAIKETFDTLKSGAPYLQIIADNAVAVAPSLAELVKSLTRIGAALSDPVAGQLFFGTLNIIATALAKVLENEVVKTILEVTGRIFAVVSAIALVGSIAIFAFGAVVGAVLKVVGAVQAIMPVISTIIGLFTAGPWGLIIVGILALVAAFIYLYNTSESFRTQVQGVMSEVMTIFGEVAASVMAAILPLIPILMDAFGTIASVLVETLGGILTAILPLIPVLVGALGTIITGVVPIISALVSGLVPALASIIAIVLPLVTSLIGALVPALSSIISGVMPLVSAILGALVPAITAILSAVIPVVTTLIGALLPVFTKIISAIVPLITTIMGALIPVFTMIIDAVLPLIDVIISALVPIFEVVVSAIMPLIDVILSLLIPIIDALMAVLTPLIQLIGTMLTAAIGLLMPVIQFLINIIVLLIESALAILIPIVEWVTNIFKLLIPVIVQVINMAIQPAISVIGFLIDVFNNVIAALPLVGAAFEAIFNGIHDFVSGIVEGIVNTVRSMVNGVIDLVNGMVGGINTLLDGIAVISGGAIDINVGSIPHLAKGGTVSASSGGSIVKVAEAGRSERIEPLDPDGLSKRDKALISLLAPQNSGQPIQITVVAGDNATPREIAEEVGQILASKMRKGALA